VDIKPIRDQIPITQSITYMNTGWTCPVFTPVAKAIQSQIQFEMEQGAATLAGITRSEEALARLRQALASFFNAGVEELMPTQNTTAGLNMVAGGLAWREGDGIVTCSLEHPSVLGMAHGLRNRFGVNLIIVQLNPWDDTETILAKFDRAIIPGTRLVAISHVQYSCGLRMPVEEIINLAHRRGAQVVLDGAQAAGQMAVDLTALGVDYYSMPGQKWLLGPSGTGVLYARQDLIADLQPAVGSYRSVASWEADGTVTFKEQALEKLLAGTASTALQCGLEEGVGILAGVGMAAVEQRHLGLSNRLKERLAELPGVQLTCPVDPARSSGLVTIAVGGIEPADFVERLYQEDAIAIRAVLHPGGVRLCTAFFNTEDEIDEAADAVKRVLEASRQGS
jgi:selenocysteine lyase/cysteine desulfurase